MTISAATLTDGQRLCFLRDYVNQQHLLIEGNVITPGQALVNMTDYASFLNTGRGTQVALSAFGAFVPSVSSLAILDLKTVLLGDDVWHPHSVGDYLTSSLDVGPQVGPVAAGFNSLLFDSPRSTDQSKRRNVGRD